jgi:hypothetical protein
VEDINEMWDNMEKGINETAGKIIGRDKRP